MESTSKIPPFPRSLGTHKPPDLAMARSSDVYIGYCCRKPSSTRFLNWVRAELESCGFSCHVSDRSSYADATARRAMDTATVGMVLVTPGSFCNPYSMEEIKVFLERRNLLAIFFELREEDRGVEGIVARDGEVWREYGWSEEEWVGAVRGLGRLGFKLEVGSWNWRDCIAEGVAFVGKRLGRRGVADRQVKWKEAEEREFPFRRCERFIGREMELFELERMLFGCADGGGGSGRFEHGDCCRWRMDVGQKGKDLAVDCDGGEVDQQWINNMRNDSSVVCVSGDSGVGKTELLLEFAYRFSQMYKMVLWVGGDARYIRQNFAKLLPLLGVDLGLEKGIYRDRIEPVNFKDLDEEIVERLRKELSRGIPYLLVVDNLESEKDWWEGRSVMEFLPHLGSSTHTVISTKLSRIMNTQVLRLSPLPLSDAVHLMGGGSFDLYAEEITALENFAYRLGGITLGITIVRAILVELPISPQKLFDIVNKMPQRDVSWCRKDDLILKHNPFMLQLLDVCILIFNIADRAVNLASRMIWTSWMFAPSPVSIPLLSSAATMVHENHRDAKFMSWVCSFVRVWEKLRATKLRSEASSTLVVFHMARRCTEEGYVQFHDIVRLYARKRGDPKVAHAVIRAINVKGSLPHHSQHLWAACFLLFKFGTELPTVNLPIPELLSFIKRVVIPLASEASAVFCHYKAAMTLLGQCTERLEIIEQPYVSEAQRQLERNSCCVASTIKSSTDLDPFVYQEFALLKATLLEMRALIMLRGGCYDIAQQLCRSTINIREVFYGQEHPEMVSIRETMEKALSPQ